MNIFNLTALGCAASAGVVLACVTVHPAIAQDAEQPGISHVGRIHDKIRAAKKREAVSPTQVYDEVGQRVGAAKKQIESETGITFAFDASFMSQWGTPPGGYGAVQALFTPSLQWKAFDDAMIGTGSFQFSYIAAQYLSGATGATQQARLNLNSPINDYASNELMFFQLSYTHEFPGHWLSVTVGQYPILNFDGNAYANNQQVNFIGYSLAQNGSQNYSQASLGAYAELNPTRDVTVAGGFQDANNLSANYIQFSTLGLGQYAWFLYGAWSPTVAGLGQAQYALMYYNLPSVPAQPLASDGLSFSASQALGEQWAVFLRANTAWGSSTTIQSSVAGGLVLNDPLGRNPLDQIGLGTAWNKTNMSLHAGSFARQSETMMELYWATTLGSRLQITPDVQLYFQPALAPSSGMAAVFTIRAALLL
jgi:Carbohydrate-selective porin, OprB family